MALNLITNTQQQELKPRITVFGVGGAGGNAVNNMIEKSLQGAEFVVANTDAQALQQSKATSRVQIGAKVTEGLGAGARPQVGAAAAEESIEEIVDHLAGVHMCFITAGMGGGTGTGAAPIIAQAARELGVLTVGVVTKPFQFEGSKRMRQAEEGIEALQQVVDTLIIIPNQNLFRLANEKTTFTDAFAMADDVLYQGVKGVTDLMVRPGLINLDFADVRSVMDEMGKAMMGTGEASGEDRALQAAEKAIANPLLDEVSLNGARGVLINVTGGHDLTLFELDEAANIIREKVDPDANIIVGSTLDPEMEGLLRVSVVATGIDVGQQNVQQQKPHFGASPARKTVAEPAGMAKNTVHSSTNIRHGSSAYAGDTSREMPLQKGKLQLDLGAENSAVDKASPVPEFESQYSSSNRVAGQSNDANDARELPEPAYRPAQGTPSPEVEARLKAAVNKAPEETRGVPHAKSDSDKAHDATRSGFLGTIISRMKSADSEAVKHSPPHERRQAPVTTRKSIDLEQEGRQHRATSSDDGDDGNDADRGRMEIPAFLRRQAN